MFLTDFDGGSAVIEPSVTVAPVEGMPDVCIGVFSHLILEEWVKTYGAAPIAENISVIENRLIYKVEIDGFSFGFFLPYGGAPMAGGQMEELIAMGARKFVYFGCCGVLQKDIVDGQLIVPTAAIRDEGLSFHYIAPSDEIVLDKTLVGIAEEVIDNIGLPYVSGKAWTTDAFFRETPQKMRRAKEMGAVCVEMECAALAAVAQFRKVSFIQFFWSADNLDAPAWDARGLSTKGESVSAKCMAAAVEIAKRL